MKLSKTFIATDLFHLLMSSANKKNIDQCIIVYIYISLKYKGM